MALDLRLPFTSDWIGTKLVGGAVYVLLVAFLAVVAWRLRRESVVLLAVIAVVYPFIYASSSYTWLNDEPRYLVLLIPVLVLLVSVPLTTVRRGAASVLVATGLSTLSLVLLANDADRYRVSADGHLVPREFAPLVEALDGLGIRRAFAHYWISYRLTFETGERIVAAEADTGSLAERRPGAVLPELPYEARWPPFADLVTDIEAPAWVFHAGSTRDRRWRPLFERVGYERLVEGGFAIYHRGDASAGTERRR
jgi:hypothetical protein